MWTNFKEFLSRPWVSGPLLAAILIGLIGWLVYDTFQSGREYMAQAANENGYCTTSTCEEGIEAAYEVAVETFSYSRHRIDWCLGVDDFAQARVRRGGWLKSLLVEVMYWPCSNMTEDTPIE